MSDGAKYTSTANLRSTSNTYEVLLKLAEGGMAEIFLARAIGEGGLERHVVLKRILREVANDLGLVQRFLDEARLAALLQHPNVAQIYDVGKLGASYFFTMEYVHGETVRGLVVHARTEKQPLSLPNVLAIVAGAAAGLHHAHERKSSSGVPLNIVHRDVSPSNLMVTFDGHVKVLDFGIAMANRTVRRTERGKLLGKLAYMSPEQAQSWDLDRRSDLFSLGVVMWELLCARKLFQRESDLETLDAVMEEQAPAVSSLRSDVPADVDAIVQRLLAKKPSARFESARHLVEAIEDVAAKTGASLTPTSLERMMRQRFGNRPEPWLHSGLVDARSVSISSEPLLPKLLPSTGGEAQEQQLRAVPTLASISDSESRTVPDPVARKAVERKQSLASAGTLVPGRPAREPVSRRSKGIAVLVGIGVVATIAAAIATRTREGARPERPGAVATIDGRIVQDAVSPMHIAADASRPPDDAAADGPPADGGPNNAVAADFAAGRYGSVRDACRTPAVFAEQPSSCVVAACRIADVASARAWLKRLARAAQSSVVADCRRGGVELGPSVHTVNECEADPMACQK